jgi:uncharacterized protein with GYD domain
VAESERNVRIVRGRRPPQTYVLLTTLTDDGARTIKTNPERIKQVNEELAHLGIRVVAQWAVLGLYDFISVVEAEDNVTVARVSAELASRGSIRVMTLPAIPIDEFIAGIQMAIGDAPPGS